MAVEPDSAGVRFPPPFVYLGALLVGLGVSAQDIVAALRRQNTVTPAGSVDTDGPQVFIRADGAYDSVQTIADTPIVAAGRTLNAHPSWPCPLAWTRPSDLRSHYERQWRYLRHAPSHRQTNDLS